MESAAKTSRRMESEWNLFVKALLLLSEQSVRMSGACVDGLLAVECGQFGVEVWFCHALVQLRFRGKRLRETDAQCEAGKGRLAWDLAPMNNHHIIHMVAVQIMNRIEERCHAVQKCHSVHL